MHALRTTVSSSARQCNGLDALASPAAQIVFDLWKPLGAPCNEVRTSVVKGEPMKLTYTTGPGGTLAFIPMLQFTLLSFYSCNVLSIMTPFLECH